MNPSLRLAQEQLDAALQLLACFVLTDEEATAALHAHYPDCQDDKAREWALEMQNRIRQLCRDDVVKMLLRRGSIRPRRARGPRTAVPGSTRRDRSGGQKLVVSGSVDQK